MNMKVKELLNESNWIKHAMAKDKNNLIVEPESAKACKWCLVGAVKKCYRVDNNYYEIFNKIEEKVCIMAVWNDAPERVFEDVKKLIEELDI